MGEREVVERYEVTEKEEVHFCDFCGRSSEEFGGTFNDVYINPRLYTGGHGHPKKKSRGCTRIEGNFVAKTVIEFRFDELKHFCNECHSAHIEVHNDDS